MDSFKYRIKRIVKSHAFQGWGTILLILVACSVSDSIANMVR